MSIEEWELRQGREGSLYNEFHQQVTTMGNWSSILLEELQETPYKICPKGKGAGVFIHQFLAVSGQWLLSRDMNSLGLLVEIGYMLKWLERIRSTRR